MAEAVNARAARIYVVSWEPFRERVMKQRYQVFLVAIWFVAAFGNVRQVQSWMLPRFGLRGNKPNCNYGSLKS